MEKHYRIILSLDGGGVRGVLQLRLLQLLCDELQSTSSSTIECGLLEEVNMYAASSASTLISSSFLLNQDRGKTQLLDEVLSFYLQRGSQVFSPNIGLEPEVSNFPLAFAIERFFKGYTLEDLERHFLFVAWDEQAQKPFVFSDTMLFFRDLDLSNAVRACAAQERVYPPVKVGNHLLRDALNEYRNPSLLAYRQARMLYPGDSLILLSLGVGDDPSDESPAAAQARKVNDELLELTTLDRDLVYFRFQPKLINWVQPREPKEFNAANLRLFDVVNQFMIDEVDLIRSLKGFFQEKVRN